MFGRAFLPDAALGALVSALTPFARFADRPDLAAADDTFPVAVDHDGNGRPAILTIGHCRQAREALAAIRNKEKA